MIMITSVRSRTFLDGRRVELRNATSRTRRQVPARWIVLVINAWSPDSLDPGLPKPTLVSATSIATASRLRHTATPRENSPAAPPQWRLYFVLAPGKFCPPNQNSPLNEDRRRKDPRDNQRVEGDLAPNFPSFRSTAAPCPQASDHALCVDRLCGGLLRSNHPTNVSELLMR
jgi:hypothetical protein